MVTIATSAASSGLVGVDEKLRFPLDKVGATADIIAGVICGCKVYTAKRKGHHAAATDHVEGYGPKA